MFINTTLLIYEGSTFSICLNSFKSIIACVLTCPALFAYHTLKNNQSYASQMPPHESKRMTK